MGISGGFVRLSSVFPHLKQIAVNPSDAGAGTEETSIRSRLSPDQCPVSVTTKDKFMQVSGTLECEARRYRPKWWIRAAALGFLAFSLAGLAHFWGSALSGERAPNTTEIIVPALMVLLGFILTAHFFTASVTLLPDAIEVRTFLSTKKLGFDQISGRREYEVTDSDGVKTQ